VVSVPGAVTFRSTDDGRLVEDQPLQVTCTFDGHRHEVSVAQFLRRDVVVTCRRPDRCGLTFSVPAAADEVVCPHCRLHQQGPAVADPARRDQVARIRSAHVAAQRARLGHR
jgi:hypothetical protein